MIANWYHRYPLEFSQKGENDTFSKLSFIISFIAMTEPKNWRESFAFAPILLHPILAGKLECYSCVRPRVLPLPARCLRVCSLIWLSDSKNAIWRYFRHFT